MNYKVNEFRVKEPTYIPFDNGSIVKEKDSGIRNIIVRRMSIRGETWFCYISENGNHNHCDINWMTKKYEDLGPGLMNVTICGDS